MKKNRNKIISLMAKITQMILDGKKVTYIYHILYVQYCWCLYFVVVLHFVSYLCSIFIFRVDIFV